MGGAEPSLDSDAVAFFNQLRQRQKECIQDIHKLSSDLAELDSKIEKERERLGIREAEPDRKTLIDRAVTQVRIRGNRRGDRGSVHARERERDTAEIYCVCV
jgi:hypothetical protein